MSAGQLNSIAEGDLQLVPVNDNSKAVGLPPRPLGSSSAILEYMKPLLKEEEEDLEVKLRRIIDNVPVRVSNTSGSSAGSGSGDFHQYRQMRRKEQDRLARMEVDYQRRKEVAEFMIRREERVKAAEERTAKKRQKRQKKERKKAKKSKTSEGKDQQNQRGEANSDDSGDSDAEENHESSANFSSKQDLYWNL